MSKVNTALWLLAITVVGVIAWTVAPNEKTVVKEPDNVVKTKCQRENEATPLKSRVLVLKGYYGGIEGTVVGQLNDDWCGQLVRMEYRGKWYTEAVKSNNIVQVKVEG